MSDINSDNANANDNENDRNTNDDESPLPFRRERNLSNRNFAKRGSRRYYNTESHSSIDSLSLSTVTANKILIEAESVDAKTQQRPPILNSGSSTSSMQFSHSLISDTDTAIDTDIDINTNTNTENGNGKGNRNGKSLFEMLPQNRDGSYGGGGGANEDVNGEGDEHEIERNSSNLSDPALLDVKQKVKRFETLQIDEESIQKKKNIARVRPMNQLLASEGSLQQIGPLRVLPVFNRLRTRSCDASNSPCHSPTPSVHTTSIDEEQSEDETDNISDSEDDRSEGRSRSAHAGEYILPEEAEELHEGAILSPLPGLTDEFGEIKSTVDELGIDDFGKVESVRRSVSVSLTTSDKSSKVDDHIKLSIATEAEAMTAPPKRDFPRNYRSTRRPKTEIIGSTNHLLVGQYNSLTYPKRDKSSNAVTSIPKEDEYEEPELRNKSIKVIEPILEELIKTEETYVEKLFLGITNYGNIFQRRDLPVGLRGKKYVLFGNIEQLAEFHRDEFLPMLQRNRYDLQQLFEEFQNLVDQNGLYGYVIFTMNKQRSLKLCDVYKNYFKLIQTELDDKLGINSFLVQPIQRMARYPLLLQQFITTLFKNRDVVNKSIIEACCRLEKKLRTLLTTTNESEVINDIVDCNEFNVFYQGKFRKVNEFNIIDYTLKRTYRGKLFIFDKCIIYTEIKGKNLVFHGRYPCEHIGIVAKSKNFTLFYERRKQQECDFHGDPLLVEQWLELIRDMVNSYVTEEKLKLQERYSRENDHLHRKPPSLSLYRDSNRFSSDSGIGNIWIMPKPESNEEIVNNRTTWYAVS